MTGPAFMPLGDAIERHFRAMPDLPWNWYTIRVLLAEVLIANMPLVLAAGVEAGVLEELNDYRIGTNGWAEFRGPAWRLAPVAEEEGS